MHNFNNQVKLKIFILTTLISNILVGQKLFKSNDNYNILTNQFTKRFDERNEIGMIYLSNKINDTLIEKITIIGQTWGFLKYYHPTVANGYFDWDSVLTKSLKEIIKSDTTNINKIIHNWFNLFDSDKKLKRFNLQNEKTKLTPDFTWLDNSLLNDTIIKKLNNVKRLKRNGRNRYVKLNPGILNPNFDSELEYSEKKIPDSYLRLLGLIRYWNIIQYFYPYRNLIDQNWNDILPEFIPVFFNSSSEIEYKLAILTLISRVKDSHAQLYGNDETIAQYKGLKIAPLNVRFIESKLVVTGYKDNLGETSGLKIGDIIDSINGESIKELLNERLAITSGSNYKTQLRNLCSNLLRTNDSSLIIVANRNTTVKKINVSCYPISKFSTNDKIIKKDTCYKLINSNIAYLNVGSIKKDYLNLFMPDILKTKGLIIDLRVYPSDFIVFHLGRYFFRHPKNFVKFTNGSIQNPGYFTYSKKLKVGIKNKNYYKGKVVILIDENTQSSSEYHAMAFKTASNSITIGSSSAGADGNISILSLPGGVKTMISGIGVYYPDGTETQRIGIKPDIEIHPSIKGISEQRDEILEKAIEIIENSNSAGHPN